MSAGIRTARPRLRRRAAGDRPATSALLLHGMGGGPGSWNALAASLAPHLELWDVNLPWAITGDPRWAQDPDVRQWVSAPIEHVRAVAGGPDLIVAHSFAANVVLELHAETDLLADTPTVLVSPFYRETPDDFDWSAVAPGMEQCYTRVADEIVRRRGARVSDETSDVIVRKMLEFVGAHAPVRFHDTCRRTPLLALETLAVPMLVVGGDRDEFGAHAEDVRALARRLPHAFLAVIGNCGHFPMSERATELAALIGTFADSACLRSAVAVPTRQEVR
jgi:pimeloyl-ACP methyl ester carboxylesterase